MEMETSAFHERLFDHEMAGLVVGAFGKTARLEQLHLVLQARRQLLGAHVIPQRLAAATIRDVVQNEKIANALVKRIGTPVELIAEARISRLAGRSHRHEPQQILDRALNQKNARGLERLQEAARESNADAIVFPRMHPAPGPVDQLTNLSDLFDRDYANTNGRYSPSDYTLAHRLGRDFGDRAPPNTSPTEWVNVGVGPRSVINDDNRALAAYLTVYARSSLNLVPDRNRAPLGGTLKTYDGPVSNDIAAVTFRQTIAATDALRTGTYAKTLTFTLSTTTP